MWFSSRTYIKSIMSVSEGGGIEKSVPTSGACQVMTNPDTDFSIPHILFHHICWLQPLWSSDLKQSNEYSIKHPSDF